MRERRILLISPEFHGYWRSIASAFEQRGHDVTTFCYDSTTSYRARLLGAFENRILDRVKPGSGLEHRTSRLIPDAIRKLHDIRPEVLVVVKGDVFGSTLAEAAHALGIPAVVWLYDELDTMVYNVDDLRAFTSVATYSMVDVVTLRAVGIDAHYVALAFDPDYAGAPITSDEVTFVGARHAVREQLLGELGDRGMPVRAYGRDWALGTTQRILHPRWRPPRFPTGPGVDRVTGARLITGSVATLNVHLKQDGFTMRTFEASGVGALQLTDRADVGRHYEPGTEVLTFASPDDIVDHVARARAEPDWARKIREAARSRTLAEHTFAHRIAALESLWEGHAPIRNPI